MAGGKVADYSLDNLTKRAEHAREVHKDYIRERLDAYEQRCKWREERGIIPIGIGGMGRAGKDTAGEYLCARTEMIYPISASWQVLPAIATMIGIPKEQAWDERHQHREFWIAACHAFREPDYGMLVRMCLGAGDVAVGIRGRLELDAVIRQGIIRLMLWIDRPGTPNDITVEYGPGDCDLVIPNTGTHRDLYRKLDKLLTVLQKPSFHVIKQ